MVILASVLEAFSQAFYPALFVKALMDYMEKHVVLSLRLGLRLFHGAAFFGGLYFLLFSEKFNLKHMFEMHWLIPIVAFICMGYLFMAACSIYVVRNDGVRWKLMFEPAISASRRDQAPPWTLSWAAPWNYEIIQVRGIFPFYYMFAFKYQDGFALSPDYLPFRGSIAFFFCRNFLDLIIFIDDNIPYEKMNPQYVARFRQLAGKYRRMKKNHPVIYWVLNNL